MASLREARVGRQMFLSEPARPSNRSLPWESAAEDARTPNADASCAGSAARAKRLECVRFIGAFRPARDSQRFMTAMHDFGTGEILHEPQFPNPNDETTDCTPEPPSTFELRISFVICNSSFVIQPAYTNLVEGPNAQSQGRGGSPSTNPPPSPPRRGASDPAPGRVFDQPRSLAPTQVVFKNGSRREEAVFSAKNTSASLPRRLRLLRRFLKSPCRQPGTPMATLDICWPLDVKTAFYDNLNDRPESFEPRGARTEPEFVVLTLSPKK